MEEVGEKPESERSNEGIWSTFCNPKNDKELASDMTLEEGL